MAYIPKNAIWYIADLIEELHLAKRKRQSIYLNKILISARSPEDAYKLAMQLGRKSQHSYRNMFGETVRCKFRGIRELVVVHDPLEHGAELSYQSRPRMTEMGIQRLATKKSELSIFAPIGKRKKHYFPKWVADELVGRLKKRKH